MSTEFKLSYTGSEINEKLGKIDTLETKLNSMSTVGGSSLGGIIDVLSLPETDIKENVFYRLMSMQLIYNQYIQETYTIHCVENLPEAGLPATNIEQTVGNIYYVISSGEAYGYADEMLSMGMGVPVGWYGASVLLGALGYEYNGVIADLEDDPCDDSFRLLLSYDYYMYKDGWMKVPFVYETLPKFDITWDGDMSGKFVLDLSALGFTGISYVKISDQVFTFEQVVGATYMQNSGYSWILREIDIDNTTYPGAMSLDGGIIVCYSAEDTNAALGLPAGYLTNGIYFVYDSNIDNFTNRFIGSSKIIKLDSKYIDGLDIDSLNLATVATTGNYYDLYNRPEIYTDVIRYNTTQNLGSSSKSRARNNIDVYSKSEVDTKIANASGGLKESEIQTMINNAIGNAIGGSY